MPRKLFRLLKSYEFLKNANQSNGNVVSRGDIVGLESRIDRIFLDILGYASKDPRVTVAQTRFLMSNLAESAVDTEKGKALRDACQRHLDHLETQVVPARPSDTAPPESMEYRYLDSMTDRAAILDADYRYVFTNKANATFHGQDAKDFIGRENWQMVDQTYFEKVSKPRFDACLAGQRCSFLTAHPNGDPSHIYSANFDPVLAADGRVTGIMVISRALTGLPVPADMIVALP